MSVISLKSIFTEFLDDLQRLSKKYPIGLTDIDLLFCKTYVSSISEEFLIQSTVNTVLPYRAQIKERNLDFFKEQKSSLFKGLPEAKLAAMEEALTRGGVPEDAVAAIWDHVEVILLVTEMYEQRK